MGVGPRLVEHIQHRQMRWRRHWAVGADSDFSLRGVDSGAGPADTSTTIALAITGIRALVSSALLVVIWSPPFVVVTSRLPRTPDIKPPLCDRFDNDLVTGFGVELEERKITGSPLQFWIHGVRMIGEARGKKGSYYSNQSPSTIS
jgi:hypothetical protein